MYAFFTEISALPPEIPFSLMNGIIIITSVQKKAKFIICISAIIAWIERRGKATFTAEFQKNQLS